MSLFKTGDPTHDQYASYTTQQLIDIVTDKQGSYQPGEVETARRILLTRGLDYRTAAQKAAEKQVAAINRTRDSTTTLLPPPRVRINRQPGPSSGRTGLKGWHWVWIIFIIIRVIGCLMKHG